MPNKRGGSLNNRVGWKFTGYLIREGGHQGWGDDLINGGGDEMEDRKVMYL